MKIREDKGKVNLDFLNFYPSIFLLMENKKKSTHSHLGA